MMNDPTSEFIPTRSSLLSRLKDWEDAQGWREFFDTYWKLIYNAATRAGLTDAEAQDVVQDTILSVAKKIGSFKYDPARGSFKGWLLQLTTWRTLNQLKKRQPGNAVETPNTDETPLTALEERIADPAGADIAAYWDREWQNNLVDAAIERVKVKASPKDYEIFHLHVVKKLSAAKVAAALNINLGRVYLAKHRVASLVKKEARRLEKEMV
jgi:RNA polymerase sigma factor (sigma-70 family)